MNIFHNEIEEKIIEEDWLISENTIKLDDKEAIINDKNIELCKKEVQVESELKQKSERGECIAFTFLYIKQEGVKRDGGRKQKETSSGKKKEKGWKQYCFKYHPCDCDCSVCGFGVQIIWYFFGVQ